MSTPYRDESEALRERKEMLAREIAQLKQETSALEALRASEKALERELASVEARIGASAAKRALPLLDQVRVASPCKAVWDEMVGDARVRFCLGCEKNVYNLSAMSRAEAEALLSEREGKELCVRFYRRADGTLLTEDCPVGVKRKRRRKAALAVAGAGAMALAAASTLASETVCATTGAMAVMGGAELPIPPPPREPTDAPTPQEAEGEPRAPKASAILGKRVTEP